MSIQRADSILALEKKSICARLQLVLRRHASFCLGTCAEFREHEVHGMNYGRHGKGVYLFGFCSAAIVAAGSLMRCSVQGSWVDVSLSRSLSPARSLARRSLSLSLFVRAPC